MAKDKIVITYGTFDLLHYGHLNILKKASQLGDKLIVGVSTEQLCAEKGKKPIFDLETRMHYLEDLKYVYKVIPEESMEQKVKDAEKYNVKIFVLGDDYREIFPKMREYDALKNLGVQIIFLPRTPNISSTKLRKDLNDSN